LAKEPTVVFPGLALLMELVWRSPKKTVASIRLLTLCAITLVYLTVRVHILGYIAPQQGPVSWTSVLLTIPSLLVFYFKKFVLPINLSQFYDQFRVESWRSPQFLFPLLIV